MGRGAPGEGGCGSGGWRVPRLSAGVLGCFADLGWAEWTRRWRLAGSAAEPQGSRVLRRPSPGSSGHSSGNWRARS
ncbi:predicted protein [Streptomyces sp. AA4]|nr:predicted protein [Streptomyces sp. AA4]